MVRSAFTRNWLPPTVPPTVLRTPVIGNGRPSGKAGELVALLFQKKFTRVLEPKFWSTLRLSICCLVWVTIVGFQFKVFWLLTGEGMNDWIFSAAGSMRVWGTTLFG